MTSGSIHTINRAEFKHATPDGDKLIAEIARVSNPANEKNEETAPRLIRYLIDLVEPLGESGSQRWLLRAVI